MPFGKYRGEALEDVPLSYLGWVLESCKHVRPTLRRAIEHEIRRRLGDEPQARAWYPPSRSACPCPQRAAELIRAGLRVLAHQHHPDLGGSTADMAEINRTVEWLRAQVGQERAS